MLRILCIYHLSQYQCPNLRTPLCYKLILSSAWPLSLWPVVTGQHEQRGECPGVPPRGWWGSVTRLLLSSPGTWRLETMLVNIWRTARCRHHHLFYHLGTTGGNVSCCHSSRALPPSCCQVLMCRWIFRNRAIWKSPSQLGMWNLCFSRLSYLIRLAAALHSYKLL